MHARAVRADLDRAVALRAPPADAPPVVAAVAAAQHAAARHRAAAAARRRPRRPLVGAGDVYGMLEHAPHACIHMCILLLLVGDLDALSSEQVRAGPRACFRMYMYVVHAHGVHVHARACTSCTCPLVGAGARGPARVLARAHPVRAHVHPLTTGACACCARRVGAHSSAT